MHSEGQRPIMLICIALFALGSALAGSSQNMSMMIAARANPGIGGGGIINLSQILTADLVPLAERPLYQGIIGLVWAFASSIGPPLGGALADKGNKAWRWLFFLNLPLTAIAFLLVFMFLSVRHPPGSLISFLSGNAIVIMGSGLVIIALAWGGVRYSWADPQVLAPLIVGFSLLFIFGVYEAKVSRPAIPSDVVSNRTSLSALLTTAAHGIVSMAVAYYLPVYFQACFGASPIRSAVDFLPGALLTAPFAFVAGISVRVLKKYRIVNWAGWAVAIVGFGLLSTLKEDSPISKWAGYQVVGAIGVGMIFTAPIFPLLAPLPNTRAASALALFSFTRSFFQAWGITISSTILQNMLKKKLPAEFVAQFPPGFEIAYAAIPAIKQLEEPLKKQVQAAFAESMSAVWKTMIGNFWARIAAELPHGGGTDGHHRGRNLCASGKEHGSRWREAIISEIDIQYRDHLSLSEFMMYTATNRLLSATTMIHPIYRRKMDQNLSDSNDASRHTPPPANARTAADRARLANLDAQIFELKRSLQSLTDERKLVQDLLDALVRSCVFTRLPNNIISESFVHFLPGYPNCPPLVGLLSPYLLCQVCPKWRRIAFATPALWRAFSLSLNDIQKLEQAHNLLDKLLPLSGPFLLSIQLDSCFDEITLLKFGSTIINHCSRWEHLDLHIPSPLHILPDHELPLPYLCTSGLGADEWNALECVRAGFTFRAAPLLQKLAFEVYCDAYVPIVPWSQLTAVCRGWDHDN
ncbi:MFS domain-containing protein [Mycena venus]|uniref:MFS domain-containing protein n=1 Tax=Mycena venus TaxID=2733690 RepID=A0A8H6XLQ1_9AGAR|nr:MFS domain-containing protein [Mycena venus]